MATAIEEKTFTPDEFMALKVEHAELIDGKVVEIMPPVFDHGELALIIGGAIRRFVKAHQLGRVAVESSFRTEAQKVRAPDVCFVSTADLAGENTGKYINKAPTLAVEIISQNDTYNEVDDKASEFLRAGSKAVWIVNPRRRNVTVLTPDEGETLYKMGQSIPGGDILPGFELPVAQIFED